MKTTGVSDIPKFGLLVFLGRPNVEDESETIEPFYPSKASDGLLAPDEDPGKIEQNRNILKRSKLDGYYTKINSGTAHRKNKCNICGHLSKDSNHMLDQGSQKVVISLDP